MELTTQIAVEDKLDLRPYQQQDQQLVDYYCDINLTALCRVCLEKSDPNKKMCNIFEALKPDAVHICNMIMSCASVQILEGDGLPSTVCQQCMAKLLVAWQFKLQCESSDARLRQLYPSSDALGINPDVNGFGQNLVRQIPSSFSFETFTSDTSKDSLQENASDCNYKLEISKKSTKQKAKEPKIHQCDTCGKTFNRREYLTQHIRIHTGEKPYRCHLCEKRFVNSGHLTTHMRTHTGERPHLCSLCPKAFSTRQELHKHTMVHNGERPFVCKMCGKMFGSSSNLYSHLKHHTGEKNFTCEHCGKAFYTKQELKQHLVVHTGEKAFLCEICNKRFSQIAHLRRHSKLHKGT